MDVVIQNHSGISFFGLLTYIYKSSTFMGDTFNFMSIKFSCELISKNHIMSLDAE